MSAELAKERRENDFLLHASSHLTGSLRHAQLDVAGAPRLENTFTSEFTLRTGTFWHEWLHDALRRLGVPYMAEVNLTPWMPPGWGGTADALIWSPDLKAFVLTDFKTQKGEGMRYIVRDGAKEEHKHQASLYWHAAKKMGVPLAKAIGVLYIPKNSTRNKEDVLEPLLVDFAPIPAAKLHKGAKHRTKRVQEYRDSLDYERTVTRGACEFPCPWLTDALEPVQERQQRVYFDRRTDSWEVKLVPHWSAAFCPFPDELCDCSTQGTTKVGYYDIDGTYYARPGFEEIEVEVTPPS